ncbi:SDR family NAD(P)-dependent oxidoreductase [Polynucleobacter sp. MWH-Svant-W18]|uniref:SDR family NAD(P)-dependent oxidoreductase n=1 Tax=Polynucleobacter sp. MWH-Svant-W18 TaxID=1855909 RepID=UPI001BFE20F1|nr:SDR family oxidoreductase [Polynucleobacter sp. MWH-Svant-W18]QWD78305.1 SDR family oxidoreductase [Polynucleobacter sp. MWH-Svant-W18]
MKKILTNKVAIITGANQGLGLEIAKKYAAAGSNLMLCARNGALLDKALEEVKKYAAKDQVVLALQADISREKEVNDVVDSTLKQLGACHILVNNAGIYGPKGNIEEVDWVDWMRAIEINVCGSVLMCRKLIPHFKKQRYGKVIQLSGGGATNPLPKISAYAASKAAIVRFAETLAEEVSGFGVDINSLAPGALNTRMLQEILLAGPDVVGQDFYERSLKQQESGGASIDLAAELALFLGSSLSDGITGKLISAAWDNWREWPDHINELESSDVYTLRRIIGRDRNISWGDN